MGCQPRPARGSLSLAFSNRYVMLFHEIPDTVERLRRVRKRLHALRSVSAYFAGLIFTNKMADTG
jgi:hypothetical protein